MDSEQCNISFADSRHSTWTAYISLFTLLIPAMLHGQPTYQHLLFRCPPCCMDTQHFKINSSDSRHATCNAYHSTFILHINATLHVQPTFQHLLFTLPPQTVTCLGRFQIHFCDILLHQGHLISWKTRATWQVTSHTSQILLTAWQTQHLSCPAMSCPALPCPTMPCPALPCHALLWPDMLCPALLCPTLPSPAISF